MLLFIMNFFSPFSVFFFSWLFSRSEFPWFPDLQRKINTEKAKKIPKGKKNAIYAIIISFAVSLVFLDPQREYSQQENVYMNSDYGICLQKTKSDQGECL